MMKYSGCRHNFEGVQIVIKKRKRGKSGGENTKWCTTVSALKPVIPWRLPMNQNDIHVQRMHAGTCMRSKDKQLYSGNVIWTRC